MYSALSRYYDTLMKDFDYDAYEAFLRRNLIGKKGLDLACGSGEMTIRLKKDGYDIVGADYSAEMLNEAVIKARKNRLIIPYVLCDLNNLSIENKYDFAVSVCDGFNYIASESHMEDAFKTVRAALNGGGVFIFDISSENKLKNIVADNLFYEDNDNLTYFWQNTLFDNRVEMELTFFEKAGDLYRRFDEYQTQYIYSADKIRELLDKAGFSSVKFYNEKFKEFKPGDSRLIVCAEK